MRGKIIYLQQKMQTNLKNCRPNWNIFKLITIKSHIPCNILLYFYFFTMIRKLQKQPYTPKAVRNFQLIGLFQVAMDIIEGDKKGLLDWAFVSRQHISNKVVCYKSFFHPATICQNNERIEFNILIIFLI